MSFLGRLFGERKKTAAIAKNRLAILIAHERDPNSGRTTDYIPAMKDELLQVISKYVKVNPSDINIQFSRQDTYEVMEVNVVLPEEVLERPAPATPPRTFSARRPHRK
ncbi:MAG: cell division topological specificity factor MinE [Azoarcus sp.]|jgi:cell division topological specificity factor|nr:cell division topological specificity factor MinE [Azoarcus sp.]